MSNEIFNDTLKSLFGGMDSFLSTKSVVGEPIVIGDTTILPLVNMSFGVACGTARGDKKADSAGGMGGKVTPTAVIVIKNNQSRVININTNTGLEKLIDMVPDLVATFQGKQESKGQDPVARQQAKDAMEEMLSEE